MKKVNWIILAAFVAALGFFTSCGGEEGVGPEIILSGTDARQVNPGEELTLTFSVKKGTANLTDVVIKKDGGIVYKAADSSNFNKDNMTITYKEVLTSVRDYVYTITATDKDGLEEVKTVNVTVASDITVYTTKLLYAPKADKSSQTFIKAAAGETVTVEAFATAAADITFGYFYGGNAKASLASPSDYLTTAYDLAVLYPTATKNVTTFAKVATAFADITSSAAIKAAYDNGTLATDGNSNGATRIYDLAAGDVVAFKTGDAYGVAKVVKVEGTFNAGDYIELEIKVQN